MAADELYVNGTKIEPAGAGVYGTRSAKVEGQEWGTPDETHFYRDNAVTDGLGYLGSWAAGRPFTLVIDVDGVGSVARGKEEAKALNLLCQPSGRIVEVKLVRDNPAGGSYSRALQAILEGRPHWQWAPAGGRPGVRASGDIRWEGTFRATYPWWRNASASTQSTNTTGTTPVNLALTRLGDWACGLKVSISTAGTLGSVTITDGVNTMVVSATFGGTAKWLDWHHTTPGVVNWSSGVSFSGRPHLELHSASTTLTFTPGVGSTGTHTFAVDWFPIWETA